MTDFDLTIDALSDAGDGAGTHQGRRVHVPYTIPGERVTVRPQTEGEETPPKPKNPPPTTKNRRETAKANQTPLIARGVRLLEASADRVVPRCVHFGQGRCGICRWQHIDPTVHAALKQDMFVDMLTHYARLSDAQIDAVLRPILPAPAAWAYNQHITFQVANGQLGYPDTEGGTHAPIIECPIVHPDLMAFADALDLDLTGVRRVKLMRADNGMMLILTLLQDEAPDIEMDVPASINAILPDNEPLNLLGDSHARYTIDGRAFRVTAGAFIRPNIDALPGVIRAVIDLLDPAPDMRLLDLYAGVGVFAAFMAARAAHVTLIESYPPAATDADVNLAAFDNLDIIEGGVDAVLPELDEPFDAAVIDPPSGRYGGVTDATVTALAARGVRRLLYLSGDPVTLTHDVRKLARAGWRLTAAQPFDLAPNTPALEAAVRFER
jgi:23S rRNA (uracil1939-C5)-methyltransferase